MDTISIAPTEVRGNGTPRLLEVRELPPDVVAYDPGLARTAFCRSAISTRERGTGNLLYRGMALGDLIDTSPLLDLARLLVLGALPADDGDRRAWHAELEASLESVDTDMLAAVLAALPPDADGILVLAAGFTALSAASRDGADPRRQAVEQLAAARVLTGLAVVRAGARRVADPPDVGTWLSGLVPDATAGTAWAPQVLELIIGVMADHEVSCSTAVLRATASAGVGAYGAASAAASAFAGPKHGGASAAAMRMLERIRDEEEIPALLEAVHDRGVRLPGFGHRVGSGDNKDWRVRRLRAVLGQLPDHVRRQPVLGIANALEEAVAADSYFSSRALGPNPDFFLAQLFSLLGYPADLMTTLMAFARATGWAAHWLESASDPGTPLIRPRHVFVPPAAPEHP